MESPAALLAFQHVYGFTLPFRRLLVLAGGDTAVTMRAAAENLNGANAAIAYATDGALAVLDLRVLSDPHGAQVVYQPTPIARGIVAQRHPQLGAWLAPVFASLDLETLRSLNAKVVVVEGQGIREVAATHLRGLEPAR